MYGLHVCVYVLLLFLSTINKLFYNSKSNNDWIKFIMFSHTSDFDKVRYFVMIHIITKIILYISLSTIRLYQLKNKNVSSGIILTLQIELISNKIIFMYFCCYVVCQFLRSYFKNLFFPSNTLQDDNINFISFPNKK